MLPVASGHIQAGAVDHDIDTTLLLRDAFDDIFNRGGIGDIEHSDSSLSAFGRDLCSDSGEFLLAAPREHQPHACGRQRKR